MGKLFTYNDLHQLTKQGNEMQKLALTNMIADYKLQLAQAETKAAKPRAIKVAQWQKVINDLKEAIANAEVMVAAL